MLVTFWVMEKLGYAPANSANASAGWVILGVYVVLPIIAYILMLVVFLTTSPRATDAIRRSALSTWRDRGSCGLDQ